MNSFSETQLKALEDAIAQGSLRVKYQDKEVLYRSLDEMLRIRNIMRKSLAVSSKCASRTYFATSKGLG